MPVEIMLLPRSFPFHLDKVSYWARTVMVPLLVLQALKPGLAMRAASRSPNCSSLLPKLSASGQRARIRHGSA